jgi:orotate phosphoribosyltransferase
VLIVEDVTTSGGSVVKTIQILRENNAEVEKVLVVVDRETGAREQLQKLEVEFIPLVSVSEILKNKKH